MKAVQGAIKKQIWETHPRAAASRVCCTLTHETGWKLCHPELPKIHPPTALTVSFYIHIQIYTPLLALRAPGRMAQTLQGTAAWVEHRTKNRK